MSGGRAACARAACLFGSIAIAAAGCTVARPPDVTCGVAAAPDIAAARSVAATDTMLPAFREIVRARAAAPGPVTVRMLALSAGGQFGAYGAGFLRGWAENPAAARPDFDVVTGVSAGGILAPLAFAGREFDALLDFYDGLSEAEVYTRRPLVALARAPSLSDPAPLERLLRAQVTPDLVEAIAARHEAGARLMVATTNLDTTEQAVFDLGAVASSPLPIEARRACIVEVMLASSAIPGLLPPRRIDGALHVDGGLREQIFLTGIEPARAAAARKSGAAVRVEATLIVNGALAGPAATPVEDTLLAYGGRAVGVLADETLRDSIVASVDFAKARPDWRVWGQIARTDLSACDEDDLTGTFDPCVTAALFADGRRRGRAPIEWLSGDALRARAEEL